MSAFYGLDFLSNVGRRALRWEVRERGSTGRTALCMSSLSPAHTDTHSHMSLGIKSNPEQPMARNSGYRPAFSEIGFPSPRRRSTRPAYLL